MERFVKGDIVVLPFPYTDLSSAKKRPALIVATLKGDNIILAQITTKERNDEDSIILKKSDFSSGMLKVDSKIMPSILFTAESFSVDYKAGKIKPEKIKEVQNKLIEVFTR